MNMKKLNVLNLYACLGGNRYKWDDVAKEANVNMKVTAVELDPEAARLYQERFPNDTVIVADAHQYLLEHYKEFDFIWSSPPCPSHSKARFWGSKGGQCKPIYPEMNLYQEIIFLQYYFDGKYVVENVAGYYDPLLPSQMRGRHLYWANFMLPMVLSKRKDAAVRRGKDELKDLCEFHEYDFKKYKGEQLVLKMARNLVDYENGRTIFETALGIIRKKDEHQTSIFDYEEV